MGIQQNSPQIPANSLPYSNYESKTKTGKEPPRPRAATAKPVEEHGPLWSWMEKVACQCEAEVTATGTHSISSHQCPNPHPVAPLASKLNLLSE